MDDLFFYSFVGLGGGMILFVSGLISMRTKRLIENIPTSRIRSLAMGLAEVYGEAVPVKGKLLKSPLSNQDCVYYRYQVDELRSSGRSTYWATLLKGEEGKSFLIRDDTGTVLVSTEGAKIEIKKDHKYDTRFGEKPPQTAMDFLKRNGISAKSWIFSKQMRLTESYISPGDKLYVMGTAGDNPFVDEASSPQGTRDIMIQKGRNDRFFYISDSPERGVLSKYRNRMLLGLLGGGALITGCLAVILLYLRMI